MRTLGNLSGLLFMAIGAALYKVYTKVSQPKESDD